ncbi:Hypothetical protein A7982_07409 [Minicystis rosea]|nr:Hypothetical protein A7982_07409 [Minicystis rosea]
MLSPIDRAQARSVSSCAARAARLSRVRRSLIMALIDPSVVSCPHDAYAVALHDPAGRDFLVALGAWEARFPPGRDFGLAWALAGLWHVQLWHPRRRASTLVFHRSRWIVDHDVHLPDVGRVTVRSPNALARLFESCSIEPPPIERVHRLADVAYARTLTALGGRALAAMSCPVHRTLIPSA